MKLGIISHTDHYNDQAKGLCGWGPTVREINFLSSKFDEVYHVACLKAGQAPKSFLPYSASNIKFISIPPSGGKSLSAKLSALFKAPSVLRQIESMFGVVDAVQLRVPTGMANYILPYLTLKRRDKPLIWVKYAGNWKQSNAPAGYRFQKWWLTNNYLKCKVTINGNWPDQPAHCRSFENPCLDETERAEGLKAIQHKNYSAPYTACFIGRIETAKGVQRIIDALPLLATRHIRTIHFIGEGSEKADFINQVPNTLGIDCIFHGEISRHDISGFLSQSHFLLLPSTASEGFPKVIAEGANYGAIPVVSAISSIGQYVNHSNGYLWDMQSSFESWLTQADWSETTLISKATAAYRFAEDFTFEHYYKKLRTGILHDFEPGEFNNQ